MNKTKNMIVSVLLALTLLFASIVALVKLPTQEADATSSEYHGEYIYYFTDYYPTLDYYDMNFRYPGMVYLDRQAVTEASFARMVSGLYFDNFSSSIAVIDIKSFKPSPNILRDLFEMLHQRHQTVFVTAFPISEYSDTEFLKYVDYCVEDTELVCLKNFIIDSLKYQDEVYGSVIYNTCYLLDSNLINLDYIYSEHNNIGRLNELFYYSPFVKKFFEVAVSHYNFLPNDMDCLQLMVHMQGYQFLDILNGRYYNYSELPTDKCGFGFWSLTKNYYDFLWLRQNNGDIFPVHVMPIDLVNYDLDGLQVTVQYPNNSGYEETDEAAMKLRRYLFL